MPRDAFRQAAVGSYMRISMLSHQPAWFLLVLLLCPLLISLARAQSTELRAILAEDKALQEKKRQVIELVLKKSLESAQKHVERADEARLKEIMSEALRAAGGDPSGPLEAQAINRVLKDTLISSVLSALEKSGLATQSPLVKEIVAGRLAGGTETTAASSSNSLVSNAQTEPTLVEIQKDIAELKRLFINPETFKGFNFGIGLSLTADIGEHDRVKSAEIINNTVAVKEEQNVIPRFLLESHYFFTPRGTFLGKKNDGAKRNEWGWGPFVAVQPGDDVIDAVGVGLMMGFRRKQTEEGVTKLGSFNLGVGVIWDPATQVLGDGFSPNQPPPAGETQIRYKQTDQIGIVGIFSVAF